MGKKTLRSLFENQTLFHSQVYMEGKRLSVITQMRIQLLHIFNNWTAFSSILHCIAF